MGIWANRKGKGAVAVPASALATLGATRHFALSTMSLPARFRRSRLLIVGCGDVGSRLLPRVSRHQTVRVLTSSPGRCEPCGRPG
jgi:hypothetical protein